jgi:V8-like Glu-specific endopeptidase
MRIRGIVLALGVAVVGAMPAAAAGRATPPEQAIGYWTAERVQGAQTRDVVLDVVRGPAEPRPKPTNPGNKPDQNPDTGTGTGDAVDSAGSIVTGAPWPDTSGDPVDDLVGKVLFTLGTTDYVCSASSIAPSTGSAWVVMTAGHCTYDDAVGQASNWVFVPDYETVRRFGCSASAESLGTSGGSCYAAKSLHPHAGWIAPGDNYLADVAFARMADPRPQQNDVAALPVLRVESAIDVEVTALGYPAAKKYSGSDLVYCLGVTVPGPSIYSSNPGLACDMTGGSSGGPWYRTTNGQLEATSLNSFGLRGYNGYMFGPVFDAGAAAALAAASSS